MSGGRWALGWRWRREVDGCDGFWVEVEGWVGEGGDGVMGNRSTCDMI